MKFQTDVQKSCYERIIPWMQELFEESLVSSDDEPAFLVNFGSAIARTEVVPWGETEAIIATRSCVVTDVTITPDLMEYLLRENDSLYFGRFAIDEHNDIIFEHSLVGSTCDPQELKTSVVTVVKFADEYDDNLVQRWGGKRALDRHPDLAGRSEDSTQAEA